MIRIFPAEQRYSADHGWLKSSFGFSFADYYDPANMNFGPLRVFNDDIIKPGTGFGMHGHREMEIVTVVMKGGVRHEDSMGNKEVLRFGEIQRMTAGTGIRHSEVNASTDEDLELFQLWFEPNVRGLAPSYETIRYEPDALRNVLHPVVSGSQGVAGQVAHIHQDMSIYLSSLEGGQTVSFKQDEKRLTYVFVIEGEVTINGTHALGRRDSARITEETALDISAAEGAVWMLIDLPAEV